MPVLLPETEVDIHRMNGDPDSEIVISGISGKFPESSNIEEFKENLMTGLDMVTDDDRRWTPGIKDIYLLSL